MALKEYGGGAAFSGVVGRTASDSRPAWPAPRRAKPGAPNVLFIVLDDVGFGQLGCYGAPIRTPNLDRLAQGGLRYANLHTTALCSPSRSCILTGRNHHANGMACITEASTGYPGYDALIPFENGFLSEMLLQSGYSTFAVGKWHLAPAEQISAAGPFERWPLGRGFERYYGFLSGDTSQYYPDLTYDNHQITPPRTPEEGYHLTEDLADRAMAFIADAKQVAPDKPFFLYFATGAAHAPHHVPREWADRYAGQFDDGYEAYREQVLRRQVELGLFPPGTPLSRHDPDVARWASLRPEEKRLSARMMEVFAGFLEHTDHHIGRLLGFLERLGELDRTLVMAVSDNGASGEGGPYGSVNENRFFNNVPETLEEGLAALDELGGPKHYNHYPWGWAWAGDTPFRRWKRETYRGGVTNPLIVHWPRGIQARGEIRHAYAHLIDLVPTVLEALHLRAPERIRGVSQSPLHGVSFAHTFDDPGAKSDHHTQYFEMFAHRALYHDGWRAVCPFPGPSFAEAGAGFGTQELTEPRLRQLDATGWELYRVDEDPAETKDLAQERRDVLIEMISLWYAEAGKYEVLPLDSRGLQRMAQERPQFTEDRTRYTYYPGTSRVPEDIAAHVLNRPHRITAELELEDGAEGVLFSQGGSVGGYSLYVQNRRLHYAYNYVGNLEFHVVSDQTLPRGKTQVRFEFVPTGPADLGAGRGTPGRAQLYIDDHLAADAELPVTVPLSLGMTEGLICGRDAGSGVTRQYRPPFAFTGTLHQVTVEVSGERLDDAPAKTRAVLARQ